MKREKGRYRRTYKNTKEKKGGGGYIINIFVQVNIILKKERNSLSNHRCPKTCYNFSQIVCQWFS